MLARDMFHNEKLAPQTESNGGSFSDSTQVLAGLHPDLAEMLEQFVRISRIPRPSGKEEEIRNYLASVAQQNGWEHKIDATGNIVIYVPGAGAGVDAEPLALQAHMDMVCMPSDMQEIALRRDTRELAGVRKDALTATDTSLGADNGIGIAAMLALARMENLNRPPLELVITVSEETDLSGAFGLDTSLVNARKLINLDTESFGTIYISSAGGRTLDAEWDLQRVHPEPGAKAVRIRLDNFPGGHSGVKINEPIGNPLAILASGLADLTDDVGAENIQLASLNGGVKSNAIPTEAEAVVWIPAGEAAKTAVPDLLSYLAACLREPRWGEVADCREARISITPCENAFPPIEKNQAVRILNSLQAFAVNHGALAYSDSVPGLVETSNNFAIARTDMDRLSISSMARSSRSQEIHDLHEELLDVLSASKARTSLGGEFPSWEADLKDPLLAQVRNVLERTIGQAPGVAGIHAGLECGVLAARIPGLQAVSIGPDVLDPHSTRESLVLDSLHDFWRSLTGIMEDLAQKPA